MARTINSPGVETKEFDLSERSSLQAGTNVLAMGYAHQGETNKLIQITTKDELNEYFFGGNGPTNHAEQYFYHSCAEVLNSPANLYTVRLPYGTDTGAGFDGGYVALAYGGSLRKEKVTRKVTRSVCQNDFIPAPTAVKHENEVYLYEFSSGSVKQDDPSTSALYDAIFDYVKGEINPDLKVSDNPFEYISQIPLENDKIWFAKTGSTEHPTGGMCIEVGELQTIDKTYPVDAYEFKDGLTVPVPVFEFLASGADVAEYKDVDPRDLTDDDWGEELKTIDVRYTYDANDGCGDQGLGTVSQTFIDNTLNANVELWNEYKESAETSDIPSLQGIRNVYHKIFVKDEDGNITAVRFFKAAWGRDSKAWEKLLYDQATATTIGTHKANPDAPHSVYIGETIAPVQGTTRLVVDTPTLAENLSDALHTTIVNIIDAGDTFKKLSELAFERVEETPNELRDAINEAQVQFKTVFGFSYSKINEQAEQSIVAKRLNRFIDDFGSLIEEYAVIEKVDPETTTWTKCAELFHEIMVGSYEYFSNDSRFSVTFKDGIPLQDADTQNTTYTGIFSVEAVDKRKFGKKYSIGYYNNFIDEDKITEITVQEPVKDSEGGYIYQNVLYVNPEPLALPLSDFQMTAIAEGAIKYEKPEYFLQGLGTGEDAFRTILGKAAFFIVNKMSTTVDDRYQGFYTALMDTSPFVTATIGTAKAMDEANDVLKEIKYVGTYTDTDDVPVNVLPLERFDDNFSLSGADGLSNEIRTSVDEQLNLDFFKNNLVVATVRMLNPATSDDTAKLVANVTEVNYGSFDPRQTVIDRATKGRVPNDIMTKVNNGSNYAKIWANEKFELSVNTPNVVKFGGKKYINVDVLHGCCCSLGVETPCKEDDNSKYIGNVNAKVQNALSLCDSPQDMDLDIVIDAGLTTIFAYCQEDSAKTVNGVTSYPCDCEFNANKYIENNPNTPYGYLKDSDNYTKSIYYNAFNTLRSTYQSFCDSTRKDCIFVIDPIRACFVRGTNTKLMDIKGKNFAVDVERPLRSLYAATNTNYGCTYANWVQIYDNFTDTYIWMPSSPWAASTMAKLDSNFYPWYAPFGLNNGILGTINDIAMRTNQKQQDTLYKMGLNMFVFFNGDGFAVWGQKTLQNKASAFDRINVRRCFLTLERATVKCVRYYIGEPNTAFTRTRVGNALAPIFDTAKANQGVYDYKIVCDERNNTSDVIDNNEMVVDIYIKPVRTAEFILCNFYCTKTSANFDELIG